MAGRGPGTGFEPVVATNNTTSKKRVTGTIEGLQMYGQDGARTSPEYADIRADIVEKRFDRNPRYKDLQKEEIQIKCFPNPFKDEVNLSIDLPDCTRDIKVPFCRFAWAFLSNFSCRNTHISK